MANEKDRISKVQFCLCFLPFLMKERISGDAWKSLINYFEKEF